MICILISLSIDTHSFDAIEENDVKYRIQVRKDNAKLIMDIEEGIRYQYELHEKTASYLNNRYPKYDPNKISLIDKRIVMSHSLYTQNFKSIHAAYTTILNGKIVASQIIARRIHESILTQYYLGVCDEDEFVKYFIAPEIDHFQSIKLKYNDYKQKLYDDDAVGEMTECYSKLSEFIHPTWKTLDIGYNQNHIKIAFLNLYHSLLFNVLSYCQVYAFDQSFPKTLFEFVQSFVDEQLYNSNDQLMNFFPNKKNIIAKLLWHPDKQH